MRQLCKICTNKKCPFAFMTHGELVILCPSLTMSALKAYAENMAMGVAAIGDLTKTQPSNITASMFTKSFGLYNVVIN